MKHLILALSLICASSAHAAYYGVLDNGEVMGAGKYKLTGDLQALTENGGVNVGVQGEMGFNDEFGVKALLGTGKTDFFSGLMFKWMPIPDVDNQPAMGFNIGLLYGNYSRYSDLTFRFEPLLSKRILIEQTAITPYVALPIGIRARNTDSRYVDDDSKMTFQLVLGSQLQVEGMKNLNFIAEIGLDLDQAPGYISLGAIMYFDSQNGFSLN